MIAPPKFDWTITPGTIIGAAWFAIVIPAAHFVKRIDTTLTTIMTWLKEFPPHRHINGSVLFPKGMKPDGD